MISATPRTGSDTLQPAMEPRSTAHGNAGTTDRQDQPLTAWAFTDDQPPFRDKLLRTAVRLTRNREDAEDLIQETYLRAFRHYSSFQPGTNLQAWLFRILKNTFINQYRRAKRAPHCTSIENIELTSAHQKDAATIAARTPEDELQDAAGDAEVRQAVAALPHYYRMVVLLTDIEGYSYKETAAILEIPVGTVMSRLFRARQQLEKSLLSFGVRYNYLSHVPRRSRSSALADDPLFQELRDAERPDHESAAAA